MKRLLVVLMVFATMFMVSATPVKAEDNFNDEIAIQEAVVELGSLTSIIDNAYAPYLEWLETQYDFTSYGDYLLANYPEILEYYIEFNYGS